MLFQRIVIGHHAVVLLVDGPTARVDHRPTSFVQQPSEFRIPFVHVQVIGIAAVQFHVVHIPFGERGGVQLHVIDDARVTLTGFCAVVLVDAEFQAFAMNLAR